MTIKFLKALAESSVVCAIIRDKLNLAESCELDILCNDPDELLRQLKNYITVHLPSCQIKTAYGSSHRAGTRSHLHMDVYEAGTLQFRYDVLDQTALLHHNCLTVTALTNWELNLEKRSYCNLDLYYLHDEHMNVILVSEFLCYFIPYPSKYKHWNYLANKCGDEAILLDIMHGKIDTSSLSAKQASQWRKKAIFGFLPAQIHLFKDVKRKIVHLGIKEFLRKAIGRIFR